MKIALLQLTSGPDKGDNLALLDAEIRRAAGQGARLIVAPEAASQGFNQGRLDTQAEDLGGPFSSGLRELAAELGVTIVAGMFRPADRLGGRNRVFNTALITGGGVHKGYDKIHTFDVSSYRESDTVKPGGRLVTFLVDDLVVGVATCFDIRFPGQFTRLAMCGAGLVVVPTSWADGPGKLDQWRTLTQARALDAGVYIAGAGQARPGGAALGGQASGPTGVGHSVVISPSGERIAEAGFEPTILYAEVDPGAIAEARARQPLLHYPW
ncbi:carbon-nitrogen hydrolase family protein [Corynebacterium liangguodongii]|uniref:Amidohydrolase n=1 Tax=Corynebacterium liangguodongii TaxID=2079535 RepID=A0A2S0WG70_9CORY|nr:carbon-nitrogen hydrolase family protein [Corynebacterium liangguodongii]AWB84724.1 amidohydrolase [Corynebacterium liangguodongii]PWB99732.1 amidohydrolase [Corynebacterium liangguodongii]